MEKELCEIELKKIPLMSPLKYVQKRIDQLELHSNFIGNKLNENCLKHYDNIE